MSFSSKIPRYITMKYNIEVFTTSNCPACDSVKEMLNIRNLVYKEFNVTNKICLDDLRSRVPYVKSVPQVFINNIHIGGLQDLVKEFTVNDYY
jgi:glutaredoxin 3